MANSGIVTVEMENRKGFPTTIFGLEDEEMKCFLELHPEFSEDKFDIIVIGDGDYPLVSNLQKTGEEQFSVPFFRSTAMTRLHKVLKTLRGMGYVLAAAQLPGPVGSVPETVTVYCFQKTSTF